MRNKSSDTTFTYLTYPQLRTRPHLPFLSVLFHRFIFLFVCLRLVCRYTLCAVALFYTALSARLNKENEAGYVEVLTMKKHGRTIISSHLYIQARRRQWSGGYTAHRAELWRSSAPIHSYTWCTGCPPGSLCERNKEKHIIQYNSLLCRSFSEQQRPPRACG